MKFYIPSVVTFRYYYCVSTVYRNIYAYILFLFFLGAVLRNALLLLTLFSVFLVASCIVLVFALVTAFISSTLSEYWKVSTITAQ